MLKTTTLYSANLDTFYLVYRFLRYLTSTFQGFDLDLWLLTFRCHLRSKRFLLFESLYKTFYLTSIDTFSLSRTVFEIFDVDVFGIWPLPLIFKRSHEVKNIFTIQKAIHYFLSDFHWHFLSISWYSTSKFLGFDLDLWQWEVIRDQKYFCHSKAHTWLPI